MGSKKKLISNEAGTGMVEIGAGAPTVDIPVDKIYIDESRNQRHLQSSKKEIEELARSIVKSNGLIQPVVVRPLQPVVNGDGHVMDNGGSGGGGGYTHELILGFQRVAAITFANAELSANLPVLARVLSVNDEQAMAMNLDENLRRKNLTLLDVAYLIKRDRDAGKQFKEIAERFGKTPSWANQQVAFTEFRAPIQKLLHDGGITSTQARGLVGLTDAQQDDMLAQIKAGTLKTSEAVREERKKKKKGKRDGRGRKASKAPKLAAVVQVFEDLATPPAKVKGTGAESAKESPKQVARRKIAGVIRQYLLGALKVQALGKAIEKLVY